MPFCAAVTGHGARIANDDCSLWAARSGLRLRAVRLPGASAT